MSAGVTQARSRDQKGHRHQGGRAGRDAWLTRLEQVDDEAGVAAVNGAWSGGDAGGEARTDEWHETAILVSGGQADVAANETAAIGVAAAGASEGSRASSRRRSGDGRPGTPSATQTAIPVSMECA